MDYNTGCGKLTSFFEYEMPYEKGSSLSAPCIVKHIQNDLLLFMSEHLFIYMLTK
jgi:hypothetical protein